jgi:DNA-directed RNA polymerase III subunit RPC6
MIFGLQPNEDVTGGAWYTDGVLDEELIKALGDFVVFWVASKSWAAVEKPVPVSGNTSEVAKKAKIGGTNDGKGRGKEAEILGSGKKVSHGKDRKDKKHFVYLPFPPGYIGYPNREDIHRAVRHSGIFDVEMSLETLQQLLDLLCFDGRLVKLRSGQVYKSARTPAKLQMNEEGSSLTEVPCGRCPVFSLCEEGGPINARNCEYYQGWLEMF